MRRPSLAAVLVLAAVVPLLSGCTSPSSSLNASSLSGTEPATDGRYELGPLLQAFALDGDVQLQGDYNVLTGRTEPFSIVGDDGDAGDGLAPAWFRYYAATEKSSGDKGLLLVETFQDQSPARVRFAANRDTNEGCVGAQAHDIGSQAAAQIAASDPGFAQFAKNTGHYVYTFVPGSAPDAPSYCAGTAAYWRIQTTDLSTATATRTAQRVGPTYTVDVDATTGAIISSHEAGIHGHEFALDGKVTSTVDATQILDPLDMTLGFNVTLAGGELSVFAGTFDGATTLSTGTITLQSPDGATHQPDSTGGITPGGFVTFHVSDAAAGAWTIAFHQDTATTPGERTLDAQAVVRLGDDRQAGI